MCGKEIRTKITHLPMKRIKNFDKIMIIQTKHFLLCYNQNHFKNLFQSFSHTSRKNYVEL